MISLSNEDAVEAVCYDCLLILTDALQPQQQKPHFLFCFVVSTCWVVVGFQGLQRWSHLKVRSWDISGLGLQLTDVCQMVRPDMIAVIMNIRFRIRPPCLLFGIVGDVELLALRFEFMRNIFCFIAIPYIFLTFHLERKREREQENSSSWLSGNCVRHRCLIKQLVFLLSFVAIRWWYIRLTTNTSARVECCRYGGGDIRCFLVRNFAGVSTYIFPTIPVSTRLFENIPSSWIYLIPASTIKISSWRIDRMTWNGWEVNGMISRFLCRVVVT